MAIGRGECRIMIVEDHPVMRYGIRELVENERDMRVCAEAATAEEAIRMLGSSSPDVALVDITLPGRTSGLDLTGSIKERFPRVKTIILSMHDEMNYAELSLKAGAVGYIMKDAAPKCIIDAIRKVSDGGIYISDRVADRLIRKMVGRVSVGERDDLDSLSSREREVFDMISNGLTSSEIARKLGLNVHTVSSHKKRIMDKLDLASSPELYRYAIRRKHARTS